MSCYHPIQAHRDSVGGRVYFGAPHTVDSLSLRVPCGTCDGCLARRAQSWATRIMHEASLHEMNCFLTLTYADDKLPVGGSLDRAAFRLFMRRLRKVVVGEKNSDGSPITLRYFHVGEYGGKSGRPHYHACLFGYSFPDRVLCGNRNGFPIYRSPVLESVWKDGFSVIGTLTLASAAYVARYVLKKRGCRVDMVDLNTGMVLEHEYATMSRRSGIGSGWIEKWMSDVYPRDVMVVNGRKVRPPRYYDSRYAVVDPDGYARVQVARAEKVDVSFDSGRRVVAEEKISRSFSEVHRLPEEL